MLATFSIHSTLGIGQYGIIVFSALLGALWLTEHDRPILAGLLLGVALAKPTLSLPFLLPMLVKGRWVPVVTAATYVGAASCLTWWLTGTDPVTMLGQTAAASARWGVESGTDPITFLSRLNVPVSTAFRITAAVVLAVSCMLMILWRRASMLTLFAVAAATARLWTYHRNYDDLIGIFLLLALGTLALECDSAAAMAAFLTMGLVLWIPQRLLGTEAGFVLLLGWIGCAVVLLCATPREASTAGVLRPQTL
jgi:hypothetical protein